MMKSQPLKSEYKSKAPRQETAERVPVTVKKRLKCLGLNERSGKGVQMEIEGGVGIRAIRIL